MGLRKYLGLDRRSHSRYQVAVEAEFQIWDGVEQKPAPKRCEVGSPIYLQLVPVFRPITC